MPLPIPQPPVLPTSAVVADNLENAVELLETTVQEGNLYEGNPEKLARAILQTIRKDGVNLDEAQLVDYLRRLENICQALVDFMDNAVLSAGARGKRTVQLAQRARALQQLARDLTKAINLVPLVINLIRENVSQKDATRVLPTIARIPFASSQCYTEVLRALGELRAFSGGPAAPPPPPSGAADAAADELIRDIDRALPPGPAAAAAAAGAGAELEDLNKKQLISIARQMGIPRLSRMTRPQLIAAIRSAQGELGEIQGSGLYRGSGIQPRTGTYRGSGTPYYAGTQVAKTAVANARADAQRRLATRRAYDNSFNRNLPPYDFSDGLNRSKTQYNNYLTRASLAQRLGEIRALDDEQEELRIGQKLDDP